MAIKKLPKIQTFWINSIPKIPNGAENNRIKNTGIPVSQFWQLPW